MRWTIALALMAWTWIVPPQAHAQEPDSSLYARVYHDEALNAFYIKNDGKPYWLFGTKPNEKAKALISVLDDAWQNGLNPYHYHTREIHTLLKDENTVPEKSTMALELLLTDAFVNYARDLSGMRIKAADMDLDPRDWRQRISEEQALELLDTQKGPMDEFLLSLEPQSKSYQLVKDELIRLAKRKDDSKFEHVSFAGLVRPGQGAKDIPKLRTRFSLPQPPEPGLYTYDDALARAVMKFQAENGLKPDGIIGKKTTEMLNMGREKKIEKLIVNLERLRWIKDGKPNRFIIVNIPASQLWAVEDGKVKVSMPVVVGRKKRPTPSFVTMVHGMRFNPTWTVPPTIEKEDIWPKLKENPLYFNDKGMELYQKQGEDYVTVDPASVDWINMSEDELYTYKMVQNAGDNNPLGRIRVLMPNSQNVYLHDTNHPEVFEQSDRAQSSGCVRMEYPEKIAEFVLDHKHGWDKERMHEVLEEGKMKDVYIDPVFPVYLVYNTVWIGDNDQIIYGEDLYGYDNKMMQLLEKLDESASIGHTVDRIANNVD